MAKIKYSALVSDMRGKLNGSVMSKNRSGSYVRNKVTPSNPQTTAQMMIRGIFSEITKAWSNLTEAQRQSWENSVEAFQGTNIFGDSVKPSGKTLFQKLNQNLMITGQASVTTCPAPAELPYASLNDVVFDVSDESLTINTSGQTTGSKVIVFATAPLTQGTKFVKNKLRKIVVLDGNDGLTADVYLEYQAKFGNLALNDNIYLGVRVVNASGQASPMETVKMTSQA